MALIACLALPAGLLSLLSESTTGEQVDAADLIVAARVSSLQVFDNPQITVVEFAVDHSIFGSGAGAKLSVRADGLVPVEVGDQVVAITKLHPATLLGVYQMRKHPTLLDYEITSPITGMMSQGISGGDRFHPVPLALFEAAVKARRGDHQAQADAGIAGSRFGNGHGPAAATGVGPDDHEPNDTLATATFVSGLHLPTFLTGNPLILSGLTITPHDVDFFALDATVLEILHAETLAPATGLDIPDTLIGLFDADTGELLAHDDDGGEGNLSKLAVPLFKKGTNKYAVAVESAPDAPLDFDGSDGLTTGNYSLSLELELGSYIWNQFDLVMGVSPDGTFIEDFVGFKVMATDEDVLLAGMPADGWALSYDVGASPSGVTHVYGGAGDQLTDPMFTNDLALLSFKLSPFIDASGFNRRGMAEMSAKVTIEGTSGRGVLANSTYKISFGSPVVRGDVALQMGTAERVTNLTYTRVLDVDLFGPGPDEFVWSFNPNSKVKAFPVDGATNVGNVTPPAQSFGQITADMQAALVIDHGSSNGTGAADITHYQWAFTYVQDATTSAKALNEAIRRLRHAHIETYVIAVDQDPATGRFAAFGAGLGQP